MSASRAGPLPQRDNVHFDRLRRAAESRRPHLVDALPSERRGGYAECAAALEPQVIGAVAQGDAVMVKGSLGSKMGPIVKALTRHNRGRTPEEASAQG